MSKRKPATESNGSSSIVTKTPKVRYVDVRIPVLADEPSGYRQQHVDVQLGPNTAEGWKYVVSAYTEMAKNSEIEWPGSHSITVGFAVKAIGVAILAAINSESTTE